MRWSFGGRRSARWSLAPVVVIGVFVLAALTAAQQQTPTTSVTEAQRRAILDAVKALTKERLPDTLREAQSGNVEAQLVLAIAYETGSAVGKDPAAAVAWYRKAAEQGHVGAQRSLAWAYDNGSGVRVDHAESARWLRAAADQGDPAAQFDLAMAYYLGEGVPKNRDECERWLQKASDQDYAAASFYLGKVHADHPGSEGPIAQSVADLYFEKSAMQGYSLGALELGRRVQDREKAYTWYLVAEALEQREEWRKGWAAARPWDAETVRHDLPRRLADARKKLSPSQVSACQRHADTFMSTHRLR